MSLDSLLSRQAGVLTRAQALAGGVTRATVDRQVRRRHWQPLHPCVYLVTGELDDEVRARAAVLWAGDGALLSGLGAAWWSGMIDAPPAVLTVTVGRARRRRDRPELRVRRRDLAPVDRATRRGLALTAPALTVLDAAVELGDAGGLFLDRALRSWVGVADVQEAHARQAGGPGSVAAARLLAAAVDRSATITARELAGLLRRAAVTGWRRGPSGITFPAARVLVDVEGWAGPRAPAVRSARGWTVVHVTWHDVAIRPRAVLRQITDAVGVRIDTSTGVGASSCPGLP